METEEWLVGWRAIGKYIGKSAKTAQRYARDGMPFFRDPGGRPIAKPAMLDEFLVELNQENVDYKKWKDDGIKTALSYENYRERQRKEFDERLIEAQKPPRSRY